MEMRVIECATGKCSAVNCTAAAATARTEAAAAAAGTVARGNQVLRPAVSCVLNLHNVDMTPDARFAPSSISHSLFSYISLYFLTSSAACCMRHILIQRQLCAALDKLQLPVSVEIVIMERIR